jgi:hypothetical protein
MLVFGHTSPDCHVTGDGYSRPDAASLAIAAFAGMVGYNVNDLRVTDTVSHVAARWG